MTFVVCSTCDGNQFNKIPDLIKKRGQPFVDYIALLDRGRISAGSLDILEHDPPFVDFLEYGQVTSYQPCKPEGDPSVERGLALLWFYVALVSKLNLDHRHQLRYNGFCRQISHRCPLKPLKKLL